MSSLCGLLDPFRNRISSKNGIFDPQVTSKLCLKGRVAKSNTAVVREITELVRRCLL